MLKGKTIIIGVTGSIAAYKACEIVRRLKEQGADVWVAMTISAAKLVAPLTFRTLSENPVITDLFSEELSKISVPHISLTDKANLILVAPTTANIISKVANGIADDPLTTMIMAAKCPVVFAPAMNSNMWENSLLQDNISKLKLRDYKFIGPEVGPLACGEEGIGRLADVDKIVNTVCEVLSSPPAGRAGKLNLRGINILVTAGATREAIDPVRFISNRSSGKMGYAIAEAARDRGANVTLISGPTQIEPPKVDKFIRVETAEEMRNCVIEFLDNCDILIMAAAVADYKPKIAKAQKIKKNQRSLIVELEKTKDILKEIEEWRLERGDWKPLLVGFAAETENVIENAKKKLKEKNLDLIIVNDITKEGAGFEVDTNIVKIIDADFRAESLPKLKKTEVAEKILERIKILLDTKSIGTKILT